MANKGQKFNFYISDIKNMVLDEYKEKHNIKYLSKKYNIPEGTVKTWTSKLNHPELVTGKKRGRQKESELTKEDWKERYEIVKKYQAFLKAQREKK